MQGSIANNIADKIESPPRKLAASIDEMVETFECDQPAHADDARYGIDGGRNWRRKTFEIDPVVNAVNFRSGIRTALAKKPAAVIGFSRNELRCGANLAKEIVATEIFHEILPVRGDAE